MADVLSPPFYCHLPPFNCHPPHSSATSPTLPVEYDNFCLRRWYRCLSGCNSSSTGHLHDCWCCNVWHLCNFPTKRWWSDVPTLVSIMLLLLLLLLQLPLVGASAPCCCCPCCCCPCCPCCPMYCCYWCWNIPAMWLLAFGEASSGAAEIESATTIILTVGCRQCFFPSVPSAYIVVGLFSCLKIFSPQPNRLLLLYSLYSLRLIFSF